MAMTQDRLRFVDTNVVATMREHGLTHLLTANACDFAEFDDLVLIAP